VRTRGTRERLNAGFIQGSVLLATLIGLLFGSWTVFFITLVVALGCNVYAREIRFGGKGQRYHQCPPEIERGRVMRKIGLFGSLGAATVVVATVASFEFGQWGVWLPVLVALAAVAGLRKAMLQRPRR
jgi:hypothetical protein